MANGSSSNNDALQQLAGTTGIDAGGDPGDQAFVMNRKFSRLAGNPTTLVDRDFQRLQRQPSRTMLQNVPNQRISGLLLSAARNKQRRKKF